MTTKHHTFCRICEALCGIEVTVDDGRITKIEPDADHVATEGFGCIKGMKQHDLYQSPDRLTTPMKRVGDDYVPATWDEALAAIGGKIRQLTRDHGPSSVGMYIGTAAGFGALHPIFAKGFMDGLGSGSLYASATQDCSNKFEVSSEVYGFPFILTYPDVERLETLIIVGANPAISKWSFLQVSNPVARVKRIQERGGKVICVDPRNTETAQRATQHIAIRPDTDVFFYLSFLNEVLARDAARGPGDAPVVAYDRVAEFMTGYDDIVELAAPWTPERTAEVTHIPPTVLRQLVTDYLDADGAALYCSTGVNMGTDGALAFWLQEVINAITGNLDRPGGTLVGKGVVDFPRLMKRAGQLNGEETSRIGGFRKVNDAFPGGVLADEILTPGEGQLRALIVTGGNPLLTMANSGRLKEAFGELELLVTLDIFLNETGSVADWVLPTTSPFQRPDLQFSFPMLLGLQSKPYLQATDAILPPDGLQRDEATIYVELARACGISLFGAKPLQLLLQRMVDKDGRRNPGRLPTLPTEKVLDLMLRATRSGTFKGLLEHEHGLAGEPQTGEDFLGKRVLTDDGKVALAPPRLLEACDRLEPHFAREAAVADRLKMITKRHVKTHNSWTHNAESFVGPRHNTNTVDIHPEDAERLGLAEGDLADVATDTAVIRLPVAINEHLMPGVVAVGHGWGHQHAKGLSVASRTTGVNVNLLAADGPDRIEPLSGMANLTGFVVEVTPAAGPLDTTSWSGISAEEAARTELPLVREPAHQPA